MGNLLHPSKRNRMFNKINLIPPREKCVVNKKIKFLVEGSNKTPTGVCKINGAIAPFEKGNVLSGRFASPKGYKDLFTVSY